MPYFKNIHDGPEFEQYCANLLLLSGFSNVQVTPISGDFGIDILAEKEKLIYAVQCKLYSSPVGVGAVQEAYTGKSYYGADIGVVMSNSNFTRQAQELADAIGILLWDGNAISQQETIVINPTLVSENSQNDDSGPAVKENVGILKIQQEASYFFYHALVVAQDAGFISESLLTSRCPWISPVCTIVIIKTMIARGLAFESGHQILKVDLDKIQTVIEEIQQANDKMLPQIIAEEIERRAAAEKSASTNGEEEDADDPMLMEAVKCVVEAGQASTSLLQRRLRLGYARAGRLLAQLEQKGVIGPHEGSKPCEVLITYQQWQMWSNPL